MSLLELFDSQGIDAARRMASCTAGPEAPQPETIEHRLGHDAAHRITGAEQQYVVDPLVHQTPVSSRLPRPAQQHLPEAAACALVGTQHDASSPACIPLPCAGLTWGSGMQQTLDGASAV